MAIHFYNDLRKEELMKFIDLWDDEYIALRSPFITRMDDIPTKKLCKLSNKYQELKKRRDELEAQFFFISALIDGNDLEKEVYSIRELRALQEFLSISQMMENYERLEIYKLGYHDCMLWLQMIDLLDDY